MFIVNRQNGSNENTLQIARLQTAGKNSRSVVTCYVNISSFINRKRGGSVWRNFEVWLFDKISDDMARALKFSLKRLAFLRFSEQLIYPSLVNFNFSFFFLVLWLIYDLFICLSPILFRRKRKWLDGPPGFDGLIIIPRDEKTRVIRREGYPCLRLEFMCARIGIPMPFSEHAHACLYTCYESKRCRGD